MTGCKPVCTWCRAGVSNKSILGLQASLYQQQEQARLRKEGVSDVSDRHVRRKAGIDVSLLKSNPGVEARDRNDRLHIKVRFGGVLGHQGCPACSRLRGASVSFESSLGTLTLPVLQRRPAVCFLAVSRACV